MATAAIYARKSTEQDKDADSKSVARQIELAKAFAAERGWIVPDDLVFSDDAVSGAEWNGRHGWTAMKAAAGVGQRGAISKFQFLIVANQSRIGRDAARVPYEVAQIEECDVTIYSYQTKRAVSLADTASEIETLITGIADKMQRAKAATDSFEALTRRAQAGQIAGGRIYGYDNVRPNAKAPARRVVNADQAAVIRRVYSLVADGWGYGRIAEALNKDGIRGPRVLSDEARAARAASGKNTWERWALSGVRELLRADRARLYSEGVYTWGRTKRSRKKGDNVRLQRADGDANVITTQNDDWKIVAADLAARALARIAVYNASVLRNKGKLVSRPERRGAYLLSGLLRCECGAVMVAGVRGKSARRVYACSAYREKKGTCTNAGAVRLDLLHEAVILAMKHTFSPAVFEEYLRERAADTDKVARAAAQRTRITEVEIPELAKSISRLTRRLAAVDDDGVAAEIQGELKALVSERKAAEARLLALELEGRALADQQSEVERLREAWNNWAGALDDGVHGEALQLRARALIKKVLVTPLYLRRGTEPGTWLFGGLSDYDRVLAGGLGNDGFTIMEYPDTADRDRLFLQVSNALGLSKAPAGRPSSYRVITFEAPTAVRAISGGSDAGVPVGQSTSGPPMFF